jgi:hypothetical protein
MRKKLIQLANTLVVTIPNKDFIEKFHLRKGDVVDMLVTDDMVLIKVRDIEFNADILKDELELAEVTLELKAKSEDLRIIKKLSPEERAEVRKNSRELTEDVELSGNVVHLDSPYWKQKPREPCDPATLKLWEKLHPEEAKKEADEAIERVRAGTPKQCIVVKNGEVDKEWLKTLSPEKIADLRKFWTELLEVTKEPQSKPK